MLDALKGLTGGTKAAQKQADEFQSYYLWDVAIWDADQ